TTATMAASCSLVCCGEEREDDKAVIVRFSNGCVRNTDNLNFSMYKSSDENNPRKKARRILVAETDRLSYVGNNFGTGSMKCNNLCKYYVGVLNKKTMQMEVHTAQLFNMQPLALHLPPCNAEADKPENVYQFDDLLSPVEFAALEQVGSKMAALTPEELEKMRNEAGCLCVVEQLQKMPTEGEGRDKVARCAFYLSMLLKLLKQRNLTRKFGEEEDCPRIIQNKMFKTFTVETFRNGRVLNTVSTSMRTKIAAYSLALLLHLDNMTADLTLLHRDLGIPEPRMIEVAKSMGLTLIKPSRGKAENTGLQDEHKKACLVLPLVKYDQFMERRKRKKMR
uniref:RNA polymerase I subunit E n=1 Tax=Echeneis naucrates TaxID=173247 RepID=A0A665WSD3_ECHNA